MVRLLILGGTSDARELAEQALQLPDLQVISSLAGRTQTPAHIAGAIRRGGFGGQQGLVDYLTEQAIDLVIDVTHPFAQDISHHAYTACQQCAIPYTCLCRPPWQAQSGDQWQQVASITAAANTLPAGADRVFLATGYKQLTAFSHCYEYHFIVRLIEAPQILPLYNYHLLLARGPFNQQDEIELFQRHRIDLVISKNSGGEASYGKIAAARQLGLPVIMIQRPQQAFSQAETLPSVAATMAWLQQQLTSSV